MKKWSFSGPWAYVALAIVGFILSWTALTVNDVISDFLGIEPTLSGFFLISVIVFWAMGVKIKFGQSDD